jgi:hypothetical protein
MDGYDYGGHMDHTDAKKQGPTTIWDTIGVVAILAVAIWFWGYIIGYHFVIALIYGPEVVHDMTFWPF